jgi:hypothetical protein
VFTPERNTAPIKTETSKLPDLSNYTILIVEDEETNFMLLNEYLRFTGSEIIWAKNGEDSIRICKKNKNIDLVLMDIRMPGIDGFEAARQIKQIRPTLKIIAQTAFASSGDREKSMNSYCDDYLPKPIKLNDLIGVIKKQLE